MEKYIKSITAMNDLTISMSNRQEVERYAESDCFWAANKQRPLPNRTPKKGYVYQFEFGKNFIPEMSYEHRGLVIGVSGKLLYVLPICTWNSSIPEHVAAYHPIDNPASKSNYFLLKQTEFPFLTRDSVLKLNDIRTVSMARIKYRQRNGWMDPNSQTYRTIEELVLKKYFFAHAYAHEQLQQDYAAAQKTLDDLRDAIQTHGFDETAQQTIRQLLGI